MLMDCRISKNAKVAGCGLRYSIDHKKINELMLKLFYILCI